MITKELAANLVAIGLAATLVRVHSMLDKVDEYGYAEDPEEVRGYVDQSLATLYPKNWWLWVL